MALTNGADNAERMLEARRMLLLVTAPGVVSPSLVFALEREFPELVVAWMDRIDVACEEFIHPVALILVDCERLQEFEKISADILRRHPFALVAMIEPDARNSVYDLPQIVGSQLVRGVLPMNLRLDIWLSIVRLMLRGGEYFPASLLQSQVRKADAEPPTMAHPGNMMRITDLSPREMQVLELVSRGLQNKQIAAEVRLSENTVKIHLHNIIRKLGTHNRTEAAARFRDHETLLRARANDDHGGGR
ncbi:MULTISPECIES: helix-turn-helix transcriptional regulator [Phyllobacteriaceae]|nr:MULTISPECIES: response regulator transcription factor [Mesorhizobium]MDQ0331553.1 DNA-binding NarL/FixJ family response regulator [Mesorhizobium sp. YL-MeA3-2017]